MTLWPWDLAAFYPHWGAALPIWKVVASGVLIAGVTVAVIRYGRTHRYLVVGWFWFLGILFPVLGLIHGGGQSMADRYSYVSLIGLFVILAWAVAFLVDRWSVPRPVVAAVCALLLLGSIVLTRAQVSRWRDSVTLWEHTIAVTERNFSGHNMLATAYAQQENLDLALVHYEQALVINPRHARSHNNLGLTLARMGRETEAIEHYREALRIKPRYEEAHDNLGLALGRQGDLEGAIRHFTAALDIEPRFAQAHSHLGSSLLRKGDREQALYHLEQALRLDPGLSRARLMLESLQRDERP